MKLQHGAAVAFAVACTVDLMTATFIESSTLYRLTLDRNHFWLRALHLPSPLYSLLLVAAALVTCKARSLFEGLQTARRYLFGGHLRLSAVSLVVLFYSSLSLWRSLAMHMLSSRACKLLAASFFMVICG